MATWDDPSPLANPFSKRAWRNFNTDRPGRHGCISHQSDAKSLCVPNQDVPPNGSSERYAMPGGNGLEVPNQDVPSGDSLSRGAAGRFLDGRLFMLSDGTVLDYRTGRVVRQVAQPEHGMACRELEYGAVVRSWNSSTGPTIGEMASHVEKYVGAAHGGYVEQMDSKSAAYWLKAREETEKLVSSMTDEQKALVARFEAHFPKSRLVEESKKPGSGKFI